MTHTEVQAAQAAEAARHRELTERISRHCPQEGFHDTAVEPLTLIRCDAPTQRMHGVHEPALCLIAQGGKDLYLGTERYRYDPLHFLLVSVALPVCGQVIEASPERPYLCLRLTLDPGEIARLIADAGLSGAAQRPQGRGLYVQRLDESLLDAVLRLLRLLEAPADVPMLAPLVIREIFYRVLRGPQGHLLHDIAMGDSQAYRVTRAIEWLNDHYGQPLRIEDLARRVNLSVSTLHHRFKALTALSPLQYQKQLRLQEARRLMLSEGLEASLAGHRVGYGSPSQFSREYSRLFGAPPLRDLAALRNGPATAPA
ncbi:AraC family transcriptional regulator [Pseudomonas sp. RIT-PI-AD]|uniref:AraC family transcriptional regulator n=1 Tax=Pseudomonas sp. RIT-PI-AD TaxID=3035294 RepID=UPI0021D812D7|nr:AraC family transcriptional regulator [Pseudomonas sp. RIT-PI-AD]